MSKHVDTTPRSETSGNRVDTGADTRSGASVTCQSTSGDFSAGRAVSVFVEFSAATGRYADLLAAIEEAVAAAEGEAGTLILSMHVSEATPDAVWVFELYVDAEALACHRDSVATALLREKLGGGLLAAPPRVVHTRPVVAKGHALG